jgi:chaperone required for assembly of F1-ATPase|tara:strand:- start:39412 stop:40128 length:717 start_codon:yes stop_codon:yes gene_type:complete
MKRFYKNAEYTQDEHGHFNIALDERPIKTPAKSALTCRSEALAKAVCLEWNAQQEKILPHTMPVTQYCYTALDYIPKNRDEIIKTILNFLDTDLTCYRAETPTKLVQQQAAAWDPFLVWFKNQFSYSLQTTTGLSALKQDGAAHKAVHVHVHSLSDEQLAIAQALTAACGSLIMALCFVKGDAKKDAVFTASFVEELYQGAIYDEDRYGIDPTQDKQRARLNSDLDAAQIYLSTLGYF